jgi:hypothetical protein
MTSLQDFQNLITSKNHPPLTVEQLKLCVDHLSRRFYAHLDTLTVVHDQEYVEVNFLEIIYVKSGYTGSKFHISVGINCSKITDHTVSKQVVNEFNRIYGTVIEINYDASVGAFFSDNNTRFLLKIKADGVVPSGTTLEGRRNQQTSGRLGSAFTSSSGGFSFGSSTSSHGGFGLGSNNGTYPGASYDPTNGGFSSRSNNPQSSFGNVFSFGSPANANRFNTGSTQLDTSPMSAFSFGSQTVTTNPSVFTVFQNMQKKTELSKTSKYLEIYNKFESILKDLYNHLITESKNGASIFYYMVYDYEMRDIIECFKLIPHFNGLQINQPERRVGFTLSETPIEYKICFTFDATPVQHSDFVNNLRFESMKAVETFASQSLIPYLVTYVQEHDNVDEFTIPFISENRQFKIPECMSGNMDVVLHKSGILKPNHINMCILTYTFYLPWSQISSGNFTGKHEYYQILAKAKYDKFKESV